MSKYPSYQNVPKVRRISPCCQHWDDANQFNKLFQSCSLDGTKFYCVRCLWEITYDYPVTVIKKQQISVTEDIIEWHDGKWIDLKNDSNNTHVARVKNADISFPIIVCENNDNTKTPIYSILDGCHRFIKSSDIVNCHVISWDNLDNIAFYWKVDSIEL